MKLYFTIIVFLIFFVIILYKILSLQSSRITVTECFKHYPSKLIILESNFNKFNVRYIEHSPQECSNPNFPSIKISAINNKKISWIHVVNTNSQEEKYKRFIDTKKSLFPFYTHDQTFFDAPLWNLFSTNDSLSYWRGYAYAFNKMNDTFNFVGGVKWGFNVNQSKNIEFILPTPLTKKDWEKDAELLKNTSYNYLKLGLDNNYKPI